MTPPLPVLRIGFASQTVQFLQRALNLAPTKLPRLDEDSQFGPKTHGRVKEFQSDQKITSDGVVGPVTWEKLKPFVDQLLAIIDQNTVPTSDENILRQRIVDTARMSFENWGWGENGIPVPDGSPRIIAAKGYGPYINQFRPRQGGLILATIYAMAELPTEKCLKIHQKSEEWHQKYPTNDKERAERTHYINNKDIGSWCGIFATYCYRASALKVNWHKVSTQNRTYFDVLRYDAPARKGDIGVIDPNLVHHFIIREDAGPKDDILSYDGNVANPTQGVKVPWNSVIAPRRYTRDFLKAKGLHILRPKFSAMQ